MVNPDSSSAGDDLRRLAGLGRTAMTSAALRALDDVLAERCRILRRRVILPERDSGVSLTDGAGVRQDRADVARVVGGGGAVAGP